MRSVHRFSLLFGIMLLLGGLLFGGATAIVAQNATPSPAGGPSRPAHIHAGSCPDVGEIVVPLNNLTAPSGTAAGSTDIAEVEYSFTGGTNAVLDDLLASPHAVNVHLSDADIQDYIACGNVAGVIDENGSLVIGLRELNNSGYSGIAVLSYASDPTLTDVSVFIGEDLSAETGEAAATEEAEEGTPESEE